MSQFMSGQYGLYMADVPYKCCLCPEPIEIGQPYNLYSVDGERRAHYLCVKKSIETVISIRDKRDASEDRR